MPNSRDLSRGVEISSMLFNLIRFGRVIVRCLKKLLELDKSFYFNFEDVSVFKNRFLSLSDKNQIDILYGYDNSIVVVCVLPLLFHYEKINYKLTTKV